MIDPLKIIDTYSESLPIRIFEMLGALDLGPEMRALDNNISGWIEAAPGGGYRVVINSNHSKTRQRFTAAHELGHYIYHRDLIGAGVGDTRAYRSEGTNFENSKITPVHERQANSFAANVLMPKEQISRLKRAAIWQPDELARRFDVSEDAMRIRLGLPR
jgi:predicted transcriptional regulator